MQPMLLSCYSTLHFPVAFIMEGSHDHSSVHRQTTTLFGYRPPTLSSSQTFCLICRFVVLLRVPMRFSKRPSDNQWEDQRGVCVDLCKGDHGCPKSQSSKSPHVIHQYRGRQFNSPLPTQRQPEFCPTKQLRPVEPPSLNRRIPDRC